MAIKKEDVIKRNRIYIDYLTESEKALVSMDELQEELNLYRPAMYARVRKLISYGCIHSYTISIPGETGKDRVRLFHPSRHEEAKKEVANMIANGCRLVNETKNEFNTEEKKFELIGERTFLYHYITKDEYNTYKCLKKKGIKRTQISKLMGIKKLILINGVINAELGKFKEV